MEGLGPALADLSLILLHGFLGRPTDWAETVLRMKVSRRNLAAVSVDYLGIPDLSPETGLESWGTHFSKWVRNELGPGPHTLVGYSLGGRLALHALEASPTLFKNGVLISTNPGFSSESLESRAARIQNDQIWSRRFLDDSWDLLIEAWNRQDVFKNSRTQPENRLEANYHRSLLSKCLVNWSLGRQKDFRPFLRNHPGQTLTWVTGERDSRAMTLRQELLTTYPNLISRTIEQAGHRILFDAPETLAQLLDAVVLSFSQSPG